MLSIKQPLHQPPLPNKNDEVDLPKSRANKLLKTQLRIGIDCRLAGNAHAGIGRYISHLVAALYQDYPEVTWVLFYASNQQLEQLKKVAPHAKFVPAPIRHYTLREQLFLPRIFAAQNLQLLHVPHFNVPLLYSGALVVTIHDLLWHEYRGSHVTTLSPLTYWTKYVFYRLVVAGAVKKSRMILVPSQAVADTLTSLFPQSINKTQVTHEAAALPTRGSRVVDVPQAFILYVGSLYPHKNVAVILAALKLQPSLKLVIATARTHFVQSVIQQAQELGVAEQITWKYGVDDAELKTLYTSAQALVQPSFSEGFGLTGLEALAVGCPVVCSLIPVFSEVYGTAACFFDPQDPASLLTQLTVAANNKQQLVALGKKQAAQYSWKQTAHQTFAAYQLALNNALLTE